MKLYSFDRRRKLKARSEFLGVFRNSAPVKTDFYKVYCQENRMNFSRLGVSVSRVVGNSVKRNRIKRVVREWFRLNSGSFSRSVDVVFTFTKGIPAFTGKKLREALDESCRF